MLMLMSLLFGCNSKMDEATVKGVVENAFLEQNPTEGRYGWEIIGKAQWFMANDKVKRTRSITTSTPDYDWVTESLKPETSWK